MNQAGLTGEGPGRVLVVDDDLFVGRAVSCLLTEGRQAEVFLARNGNEALPLAQARQPQLVLVDLCMPGMSAVELCRALRQVAGMAGAAIYILTGALPEESVLAALEGLVQGVLTKPLDPRELMAVYDEAI